MLYWLPSVWSFKVAPIVWRVLIKNYEAGVLKSSVRGFLKDQFWKFSVFKHNNSTFTLERIYKWLTRVFNLLSMWPPNENSDDESSYKLIFSKYLEHNPFYHGHMFHSESPTPPHSSPLTRDVPASQPAVFICQKSQQPWMVFIQALYSEHNNRSNSRLEAWVFQERGKPYIPRGSRESLGLVVDREWPFTTSCPSLPPRPRVNLLITKS